MAFQTQFASFFISPFGEPSVCDELNKFLRSRRIVNVEKRLIDSERGTGWLVGWNSSQPWLNRPRQRITISLQ